MKAPPDKPQAPAQTDVLVIGGGPAGSSAAILLAERGYRVVQLEKSRHPRFHIGESLLPANLPMFERLGVADQVKAIGMQKWGAEFVSPWHGDRGETFNFTEGWNKSLPFAYQVRRSEFDEILIRRALQKTRGNRTRETLTRTAPSAGAARALFLPTRLPSRRDRAGTRGCA